MKPYGKCSDCLLEFLLGPVICIYYPQFIQGQSKREH